MNSMKYFSIVLFLTVFFTLNGKSLTGTEHSDKVPSSISGMSSRLFFESPFQDHPTPPVEVLYEKSMAKAILLTLVLPGAGEIYSGRIKMGLFFMGLEVLGWTAYIHYDSKGDDIDAEFRRYADARWDEDEYRSWLEDYKAAHGGNEPDHFTHTLPDTKTQQYYEMIGKYDQFVNWWDDYDPNVGPYGQSQNRLDYEEKRHQSNINYDRAMIAGMVIFVNRVVSLLDTIYGVKKQNSLRQAGWSWEVTQRGYFGYPVPFLNVQYKW